MHVARIVDFFFSLSFDIFAPLNYLFVYFLDLAELVFQICNCFVFQLNLEIQVVDGSSHFLRLIQNCIELVRFATQVCLGILRSGKLGFDFLRRFDRHGRSIDFSQQDSTRSTSSFPATKDTVVEDYGGFPKASEIHCSLSVSLAKNLHFRNDVHLHFEDEAVRFYVQVVKFLQFFFCLSL